LERVYEAALADELGRRGFGVEREVPVPVVYREARLDEGFRLDLLIASRIVVELKCVEGVSKAHKKQLLTYLRLSGLELGLLLNFGEAVMRDGIFRIANGARQPSA
jgi:GxxExxY protein